MKPALALLAVIATGLFASASSAQSQNQLRPTNLRVFGETAWHAENDFQLDWDQPALPDGDFVTAVDYRLSDASGNPLPATTLPWYTTHIEHLHVAPQPGSYTVEVRLEVGGQYGPWTSAALRFDDVRPGPAPPLARAGWFAGDEAVAVSLGHPPGPAPVSGIRGYAVSVGPGSGVPPCAKTTRCSVAETDLRGGIEADTIKFGTLPEGASVVRAVAVSGSGVAAAEVGSAIVHVDATRPEVGIGGLAAGWSQGPVPVTVQARDALSGMAAAGPSGPFTAIAVDGGVPRAEPGAAATAVVSGEGTHSVAFYARDAAGNSGEKDPSRASVRIDESRPTVAFSRVQDPAEPERIEARVEDRLSGPDPRRGSIAVRRAGSRQRFEPLPTTSSGGRLLARWNSDAYPPGSYEFQATAYDNAGNSASSDRRDGGVRMVLTNPLKTTTAIVAGFGGQQLVLPRCKKENGQRRCRQQEIESFEGRPTTRRVPYGHAVAYSGRLTAGSQPLGRLPVEVVETFAPGSEIPMRRTTVETAADGTFATRLEPGPSRQVEVVFAGNRVLCRSGGGKVSLDVLGGVLLRASAASARIGGAPVVFSGRLEHLAAPIPRAGRPIELQFRLPGGEWSEFRTVRTDAHGRFGYSYAFSDDDSRGVRFQFRAVAPAEDDWPYEPAASRPVFVTGR
ncbi:MAG TPA: hypothetical protein VGO36_05530 [Solirubrobacterales bacterium]|nr:hypothetical protein [Solirubrobacterales bacterium]